jgi:hypothetical protein
LTNNTTGGVYPLSMTVCKFVLNPQLLLASASYSSMKENIYPKSKSISKRLYSDFLLRSASKPILTVYKKFHMLIPIPFAFRIDKNPLYDLLVKDYMKLKWTEGLFSPGQTPPWSNIPVFVSLVVFLCLNGNTWPLEKQAQLKDDTTQSEEDPGPGGKDQDLAVERTQIRRYKHYQSKYGIAQEKVDHILCFDFQSIATLRRQGNIDGNGEATATFSFSQATFDMKFNFLKVDSLKPTRSFEFFEVLSILLLNRCAGVNDGELIMTENELMYHQNQIRLFSQLEIESALNNPGEYAQSIVTARERDKELWKKSSKKKPAPVEHASTGAGDQAEFGTAVQRVQGSKILPATESDYKTAVAAMPYEAKQGSVAEDEASIAPESEPDDTGNETSTEELVATSHPSEEATIPRKAAAKEEGLRNGTSCLHWLENFGWTTKLGVSRVIPVTPQDVGREFLKNMHQSQDVLSRLQFIYFLNKKFPHYELYQIGKYLDEQQNPATPRVVQSKIVDVVQHLPENSTIGAAWDKLISASCPPTKPAAMPQNRLPASDPRKKKAPVAIPKLPPSPTPNTMDTLTARDVYDSTILMDLPTRTADPGPFDDDIPDLPDHLCYDDNMDGDIDLDIDLDNAKALKEKQRTSLIMDDEDTGANIRLHWPLFRQLLRNCNYLGKPDEEFEAAAAMHLKQINELYPPREGETKTLAKFEMAGGDTGTNLRRHWKVLRVILQRTVYAGESFEAAEESYYKWFNEKYPQPVEGGTESSSSSDVRKKMNNMGQKRKNVRKDDGRNDKMDSSDSSDSDSKKIRLRSGTIKPVSAKKRKATPSGKDPGQIRRTKNPAEEASSFTSPERVERDGQTTPKKQKRQPRPTPTAATLDPLPASNDGPETSKNTKATTKKASEGMHKNILLLKAGQGKSPPNKK